MSRLLDDMVALLGNEATKPNDWKALLDEKVGYRALGKSTEGVEEVAALLSEGGNADRHWSIHPEKKLTLLGPGKAPSIRGRVISIAEEGGRISRIAMQNMAVPQLPPAPMALDNTMRARIDGALKNRHPMSIAYVDADERPRISLRGSLRTFTADSLCFWCRNAEAGFAKDIARNPNVSLLYRDEETKATYQMDGRARVATDEQTRAAVYEGAPEIEKAHDFARLGAAVIIELDRVEGYAGLGPGGQIDPIHLRRGAKS